MKNLIACFCLLGLLILSGCSNNSSKLADEIEQLKEQINVLAEENDRLKNDNFVPAQSEQYTQGTQTTMEFEEEFSSDTYVEVQEATPETVNEQISTNENDLSKLPFFSDSITAETIDEPAIVPKAPESEDDVLEPIVTSSTTTLSLLDLPQDVYITLLNWNSIDYYIDDSSIVDCEWGEWTNDTIPLKFTPISSGKTYVKVFPEGRNEFVTIDVTVKMHEHSWIAATCISPEQCSICGITNGYKIDHKWEPATCQKAMYCSICGTEEGDKLNHSYNPFSYICYYCDQLDPVGVEAISKSSLIIPELPAEYALREYGERLRSVVCITEISYTFSYAGNGKVSLKANLSGVKTYDHKGKNNSSVCHIGWKLYDSSNNVVSSGISYTPNLVTDETFVDLEVALIFSSDSDAKEPGEYTLALLDVNYG